MLFSFQVGVVDDDDDDYHIASHHPEMVQFKRFTTLTYFSARETPAQAMSWMKKETDDDADDNQDALDYEAYCLSLQR